MRYQCPFCRNLCEVDNSDLSVEVACPSCGETTTTPASLVSTGVVIGNDFLILEEIGRGGMGVVYLTHQMSLDRPAALKILSSRYANNSEFVAGFIKEARAAAKLNHPHIVQAYAVGEDNGIYFFAMEHIDGETMKAVLKREGHIAIDPALAVIQQIADSLDYAWKEQRLIHRDIKPDNIMITKNGRAKLADLGLARIAGEIEDNGEDEVMGTPQYISPEHLTGSPMDCRSDIYSLGASFYHILTGQFPFTGKTASEIARKHLEEPLRSPKTINPGIPDSVCRIIMKMMEKSPMDRYQTPEELVEDIRLVRRGKSIASTSAKTTGSFQPRKSGKAIVFSGARTATGPISTNTGGIRTSSGNISDSRVGSARPGSKSTTSSTSDLRKSKEKKAMLQVIVLVSVCVVAALLAAGYAIWKMKKDKIAKPVKPQPQKVITQQAPVIQPTSKQPAEPARTAYNDNVDILLDFALKNPNSDIDILFKIDEFFLKYQRTRYKCEEKALADLNKIYIPLDEKRLQAPRKEARAAHLVILKDREEYEKQKLEDIEKQKREQGRQEELAKLEKEKIEEQKKKIEEYKTDLEKQKEGIRYRVLSQTVKGNYDEALKVLESPLKEEANAPDYLKPDAKILVTWAEKIQKSVSAAKKFWTALANSNRQLEGTQLEVRPGTIGKVSEIKNGTVYVKTSGGITVQMPIRNLPMKQFKILAKKIIATLNDNEALFHYSLACGEFSDAKESVPNDDWKAETSDMAFAYLKEKIKYLLSETGDSAKQDLKELSQKYSKLPEYPKAMQAASSSK